jgi:triacylglycerol lipase
MLPYIWTMRLRLALAAVLVGALCACRSTPAVVDTWAPKIDFSEILHLLEVYRSVRYDSAGSVDADWGRYYERLEVVDLPATRNRYLLGRLPGGRQEIVIRGTVNWTNAAFDVRVRRRWNPELGIVLHSGFEEMAAVLLEDLSPRLERSGEVVIFGHSLGAAEALIVGMTLQHRGYQVRQVYGSGQPRVTDTEGARRYALFPLLRIVNENDPVPLVPSVRDISPATSYCHFGDALVLLDGPYYSYFEGDYVDEELGAVFLNNLMHGRFIEEFREHSVANYIARIEPKLQDAVQVPFRDRLRYLNGPQPRAWR